MGVRKSFKWNFTSFTVLAKSLFWVCFEQELFSKSSKTSYKTPILFHDKYYLRWVAWSSFSGKTEGFCWFFFSYFSWEDVETNWDVLDAPLQRPCWDAPLQRFWGYSAYLHIVHCNDLAITTALFGKQWHWEKSR